MQLEEIGRRLDGGDFLDVSSHRCIGLLAFSNIVSAHALHAFSHDLARSDNRFHVALGEFTGFGNSGSALGISRLGFRLYVSESFLGLGSEIGGLVLCSCHDGVL